MRYEEIKEKQDKLRKLGYTRQDVQELEADAWERLDNFFEAINGFLGFCADNNLIFRSLDEAINSAMIGYSNYSVDISSQAYCHLLMFQEEKLEKALKKDIGYFKNLLHGNEDVQ